MYVPAAADAQGSSKKKGKTKAIGDGKDDIPLGGAETLLIYPASLSQIQQAQFYQVLETLVSSPPASPPELHASCPTIRHYRYRSTPLPTRIISTHHGSY